MNVIIQFHSFRHIVAQDVPPDKFGRYSDLCLSGGFTQFTTFFPVLLGEKVDSKGYAKRTYRSSESNCKNCPLREHCCGKSTKFKKSGL